MYKVFFNTKQIILTDQHTPEAVEFTNPSTLREKIIAFLPSPDQTINIYSKHLDLLFESMKTIFKYIEAAGGIVFNPLKQVLVIYRSGKWDIPKGKIEKGETPKKAGKREVSEECGLEEKKLHIQSKIMDTYHLFYIKNKLCLKKTYWYQMQYSGTKTPKPQEEENITKAEWVAPSNMGFAKQNTHDSLIPLFEIIEKKD